MDYISTRGTAPALSFDGALLAGLARDGGLYVPREIPTLSAEAIAGLSGLPFAEVATRAILPFAEESVSRDTLRRMAGEAYATFRHPAVTPLTQLDSNLFVLELFHGPSN